MIKKLNYVLNALIDSLEAPAVLGSRSGILLFTHTRAVGFCGKSPEILPDLEWHYNYYDKELGVHLFYDTVVKSGKLRGLCEDCQHSLSHCDLTPDFNSKLNGLSSYVISYSGYSVDVEGVKRKFRKILFNSPAEKEIQAGLKIIEAY